MNAVKASVLRTIVPIVWGWVLSLPITQPTLDLLGITDGQAEQGVAGLITAVAASVYYSAVRYAETRRAKIDGAVTRLRRRWPWIVLVGWPTPPQYPRQT